uniref:Mitochondrial inner membrane protein OXA1 n=1 Tax=Parastrongyloides trichosuri TaxID=131310 RepID=A0A0N5A1F6_PARTI
MLHLSRAGIRVFSRTALQASTTNSLLNRKKLAVNETQSRGINTNDIFSSKIPENITIPEVPATPLPAPSVDELLLQGQSVLTELGLFDWYKPTGYVRWAMESIHTNLDVPWWATIVASTIALRLFLIYVPILSQRNAAIQSRYHKEMATFKDRMDEAKSEGDNRQVQSVLVEQQRFLKEKGIKIGRQFQIILINGGVFMTQFLALKKMASVGYPGLETGGTLWLENLLIPDPMYILPVLTAVTLHLTVKSGVETGANMNQYPTGFKAFMAYGFPAIAFASTCYFPAAVGVYWFTSNTISLIYAKLFKLPSVRKLFNIPELVVPPENISARKTFSELYKNMKEKKSAPPSINKIREQDLINFKKAGNAKVIRKD